MNSPYSPVIRNGIAPSTSALRAPGLGQDLGLYIADEAVIAARDVFALVSEDRERLIAAPGASVMAIRLMDRLPIHPVVTIPTVVKLLKTTKPTAGKAVRLRENLGVLTETSGKQRDRTFAYASYLEKLRVGTEVDVT
jgi:hypothetical protein